MVGEVLDLQEIKFLAPRPLAACLPYNRIITSQTFSEALNSLRHKVKYSLATENLGYADTPFITIDEPTTKLAGKSIALSFKPTTKADEDIIASRLCESIKSYRCVIQMPDFLCSLIIPPNVRF